MVKAAIRKRYFAKKNKNAQTQIQAFTRKKQGISKLFSADLNISANDMLNIKKIQKRAKFYSNSHWPNRCWATGKAGGVYKTFGLSRHTLRTFARNCLLAGLVKSSW